MEVGGGREYWEQCRGSGFENVECGVDYPKHRERSAFAGNLRVAQQ